MNSLAYQVAAMEQWTLNLLYEGFKLGLLVCTRPGIHLLDGLKQELTVFKT